MSDTVRKSEPTPKKAAGKNNALLFRFRKRDTAFGVTRRTAHSLAKELGMSETQVLHVALAQMARDYLPAYEPDDGPLTEAQLEAIERIATQGKMKVTKSLLD